MRIQSPTITSIQSLKGDGAQLTGSFSGSFNTWEGISGKPDPILSSSAQIADDISGSLSNTAIAALGASIVSGSSQLASDISGSFVQASASIATDIDALQTDSGSFSTRITTAETELGNTLISGAAQIASEISGSFTDASASIAADIVASNGDVSGLNSYTSSLKTAISVSGADTTLLGNLTVTGTRTELQVANLNVEDLNITVASGSATAAAANGAGLTVAGASATLTYASTGDKWVFNKVVDVPTSGLLINGTAVTSTATELNQLDGVTVGGTSAGDIVTIDGSQTLSNKTIAASQVTEISNLTAAEGAQLENIGTTTISSAQWGYLGATSTFGGSLMDDADAATARTTLGVDAAGTVNYTHPTHPGDDFSVDSGPLTGATVISDIDINVTTDTLGHVTDANGSIATRTLTLGDLGYTGATNANNYAITDDNTSNVHFEGLMVGQTTGATANTIRCVGDIVAYYSSDAQFKDNVETLEGALDKVKAIRGVRFDWNDKQDVFEGHDIGVIAQEVEAVLPELVHYREHSDSKAVDYVKLTAVLIEAVKELSAKVDELSK